MRACAPAHVRACTRAPAPAPARVLYYIGLELLTGLIRAYFLGLLSWLWYTRGGETKKTRWTDQERMHSPRGAALLSAAARGTRDRTLHVAGQRREGGVSKQRPGFQKRRKVSENLFWIEIFTFFWKFMSFFNFYDFFQKIILKKYEKKKMTDNFLKKMMSSEKKKHSLQKKN